MADQLAKETAEDDELELVYNKTPITTITTELKVKSLEKWQIQWQEIEKGRVCRSFFPRVQIRQKMKIPITQEFTAVVTGHGKTKSYLHRFKIINDPMCPCNSGEQTSEHLIYECRLLTRQRNNLKHQIVSAGGIWPTNNSDRIEKHLNALVKFIKNINFNQLQ